MVPTCPWSIESAIEDVRKPGQRVPVTPLVRREGPHELVEERPMLYVDIGRDVGFIVVTGKIVTGQLPVNDQGAERQNQADEPEAAILIRLEHRAVSFPARKAGGRKELKK